MLHINGQLGSRCEQSIPTHLIILTIDGFGMYQQRHPTAPVRADQKRMGTSSDCRASARRDMLHSDD